ncbi:hypothetical protein BaRGS_00009529 [Batillaria attramentaria]|uniref:Uncharacterized protein n=1 Tax=Batillaria attramentaria TaxID=370345 RepID=A0ABD0LJY6_9CAEN
MSKLSLLAQRHEGARSGPKSTVIFRHFQRQLGCLQTLAFRNSVQLQSNQRCHGCTMFDEFGNHLTRTDFVIALLNIPSRWRERTVQLRNLKNVSYGVKANHAICS